MTTAKASPTFSKATVNAYINKVNTKLQHAQAILDKYQIEDIHELMEKSQNQRSRQDVVLRLRRELEQLRKRYDELQKPLAP